MGARSVNRDTSLRRNVQEGINCIWPDGIVEMSLDPDESYFFELRLRLSRAIRRIRNTRLVYEHEPDGGPCLVGAVRFPKRTHRMTSTDHVHITRSRQTHGEGFTLFV